MTSPAVRQRYWARSLVGWPRMARAQPNPGHLALAFMERQGLISTLITQNVDGLHWQAGSKATIELHGAIRDVLCVACGGRYDRAEVQEWLQQANPAFEYHGKTASRSAPDGDAHLDDAHYAGFVVPDCPTCQGMLKPDVVFFGDNVPKQRVATALSAVSNARALLVVGSSLMVYSGYRFAELAHRLGKPVVAINQGTTRADDLLALKIEEDCSDALVRLARLLANATQ